MKKILVLGAGRMGAWLIDSLCMDYDVAVFEKDVERLKYLFNCRRFTQLEEIKEFDPEMVINSASLQLTVKAFEEVIPYISENCLLADITSVKTPVRDFYLNSGRRFVSTHPMFGPTFANVKQLASQSAIIIEQSDEEGKKFFRHFYKSFGIQIFEYTFIEHDKTIAYSLSIPFASTMVFAACMKQQEAPGTTFKKHFDIAKGLLSEEDYLLSEILFSPYTYDQLDNISIKLAHLRSIIKEKDTEKLKDFLSELRGNIGQ
ncbi:MAG: prephenate dehydrogenase/arogenate dehydrogenase family protein [Bacteroidales bacterium]|nr:prephenate dehydrogenase/arogenate dehydrogenase family protein [Bacteroidales bacterium]